MNTSALQYSSERCWSRPCSTESILSIQDKETDFVRDTSDTEPLSDGPDVEYEPCTEEEVETPALGDSSGQSDNEIISTKVIEVCVRDDGDLEFADSEQTGTDASDSEVDLCDYWRCAQCGAANNNPLYRYCEKCFKVRKNFFPPRPKRKHKRKLIDKEEIRPLSQDSGIDSQEILDLQLLTGSTKSGIPKSQTWLGKNPPNAIQSTSSAVKNEVRLSGNSSRKRRAESAERESKKFRADSDSDSCDRRDVSPLMSKTVSDPYVTVEDVTKKDLSDKEDKDMCIICLTEPKSGVFVHGRIAHICCCYKCAVKVWGTTKRCPVCNCKVSNVLRAVVM